MNMMSRERFNAQTNEPEVVDILQEREELPCLMERTDLVGIELGVASGDFSKRLLKTNCFKALYGVDKYTEERNTRSYLRAMENVGLEPEYTLIRSTFAQAAPLFPREHFDFIYVDGYAHSGQDDGRTLFQWFNKLKVGGMIAGHDYEPKWPYTMRAVNTLAKEAGLTLMRTAPTKEKGPQDDALSWAAFKLDSRWIGYPEELAGMSGTA